MAEFVIPHYEEAMRKKNIKCYRIMFILLQVVILIIIGSILFFYKYYKV